MQSGKKILLVEDEPEFRLALRTRLEANGYDIIEAEDGATGLNTARHQNPDLIILDVMLPNIDGFTIGTEIRKIDKEIPMVFLTAKSLKEDILKGYNVGADDYITKPFDTEVLLCKIQAIIKRQTTQPTIKEVTFTIGSFQFD